MNPTDYELFVQRIVVDVAERNGEAIRDILHNQTHAGSVREWKVDVSYSFRYTNVTFKVFIECKNWNRSVDVNIITHLHDCIRDCGAQKGIVATKIGFTPEAMRVARLLGIGMMIVHDEQHTEWNNFTGPDPVFTGEIKPSIDFLSYIEVRVGLEARKLFECGSDHIFQYSSEDLMKLTPMILVAIDEYLTTERAGTSIDVSGMERYNSTYYNLLMIDAIQRFDS